MEKISNDLVFIEKHKTQRIKLVVFRILLWCGMFTYAPIFIGNAIQCVKIINKYLKYADVNSSRSTLETELITSMLLELDIEFMSLCISTWVLFILNPIGTVLYIPGRILLSSYIKNIFNILPTMSITKKEMTTEDNVINKIHVEEVPESKQKLTKSTYSVVFTKLADDEFVKILTRKRKKHLGLIISSSIIIGYSALFSIAMFETDSTIGGIICIIIALIFTALLVFGILKSVKEKKIFVAEERIINITKEQYISGISKNIKIEKQ